MSEDGNWNVSVTGPGNAYYTTLIARTSAERAAGRGYHEALGAAKAEPGPGWTVTCTLKRKSRKEAAEMRRFRTNAAGELEESVTP